MIKNEFKLKDREIPFVRHVVIFKNQSETEQKKALRYILRATGLIIKI